MSHYKKLLNRLDRILDGKEVFIPNPHLRMREVFNIHKGRYILVGSNSGIGKALANSELVLTPSGWVTNGSLMAGMSVIGSNGKSTTVLNIYPQGKKCLYKVEFQDGTSVKCDDNHLWEVTNNKNITFIKTTRELAELKIAIPRLDIRYNTYQKKFCYKVRLNTEVEFNSQTELPIDPYTFGVLLGDGGFTNDSIMLSLNKSFDLSRLKFPEGVLLSPVNMKSNHIEYRLIGKTGKFSILRNVLRDLNLDKHLSIDKFIPDIYLKSSIDSRKALLQGLLDTDGHFAKNCNGINEFSTSSKRMSKDISELLGSLGIYHRITERDGKYKDSEGNLVVCNRSYRVYINFKKKFKYLVSVTKSDIEEEATCIQVDAKDHLYVVNGYNLTHNTSFVDDTLILKPYEWIKQQSIEYHYEVLYFSMERSIQDKLCKWLSWKIYQDKGLKIPSNVFSVGSQGDIKLDGEHTKLAILYEPWMEDILSHINLYQGPQYPSTIRSKIQEVVKKTMSILHSDDINIFWNGVKIGEFSQEVFKMENGIKFLYRSVTNRHNKSETIEITPNTIIYVPKKANTFVKILLDHLGKLKGDTKKSAIDEVDEILSIARDDYQFMPIAVSQFNRAIGDITRIKFTNGNLEPILEDFKDSGNTQESADLIIAPFDPYRYKSFDKDGLYKGYNIADINSPGTLDPAGRQRFRSIHILKNSYGDSQITFGMRFTGEVMDFKLLPLPGTKELQQVYNEIILNK